jgi:hypothetical protein
MSDFATRITTLVDASAPPVDIEGLVRQLESGTESLGMPPVLPPRRAPGWAVAVGAAVVVFLVIGSIALLSPLSEEEADTVIEPPTSSTVPGTTVPVAPIPDSPTSSTVPDTAVPVAPIPDLSASGLLTTGFINEVRDLAMAPDGTVWVATRGGVVRWGSGASGAVAYGGDDGLPAAEVGLIVVATDGTVWAAGDGWVAYYDETWQPTEARVDEMAADTMGGVWAIGGDVLFHIDRNKMEQISFPEQLRDDYDGVAVDAAGRVWMVSGDGDHGVVVYDGSGWQEFTTTDGLPGHILSSIAIAPDGTVWISTEGVDRGVPDPGEDPNVLAAGVASFDGETWTTYTTADGLASNGGEIVVASDGTVWVVHGDAISRLDGDTWTVHGVAGSRRRGAVGGSDGTFWLGTDNGIVHFDGTDTTQYAVPGEMAPSAASSFSLEPTSSAAGSVDAGPFGEIHWQTYHQPVGHELHGGIVTPHGFVSSGASGASTSLDGVNWTTVEPPLNARGFAASGDDLYAFGPGAVVRLAWTGTTWRAENLLEIDGLEPDRPIDQMAFGDGATVMTTETQILFSTDGHAFAPALQGPDPALLTGADNTGRCQPSFGGGGESIGPVVATESGFVALTAGSPGGWDDFPLCEPVVWTSSDGSTWDLDSAESPFGPTSYVYDMAERDGRFVAVGGQGAKFSGATLWVSEDGVTWNEIPPGRIDGSLLEYPVSIGTGEAGWVVLHDSALMYSLDGLNWVAPDGPPEIRWGYGAPRVVGGKDRILVANDVIWIGEINR